MTCSTWSHLGPSQGVCQVLLCCEVSASELAWAHSRSFLTTVVIPAEEIRLLLLSILKLIASCCSTLPIVLLMFGEGVHPESAPASSMALASFSVTAHCPKGRGSTHVERRHVVVLGSDSDDVSADPA